jgi:heme oxygenase (mycobilin-producing)
MSVVKINVLQVPEGRGEVLEQRFAARAGEVETVDGFESFDLLRPTEGTDRYLVVTKWRDDEAFQAWMNSEAFGRGHGQGPQSPASGEQGGGHPGGHPGGGTDGPPAGGPPQGGPAATGSELWGFEVVTSATSQRG